MSGMDPVPGAAQRATVVLRVRGPVRPGDADRLCDRLRALRSDGPCVVVHVRGAVDLGVVDVLARLQLVARRSDGSARLRVVADGLDDLLALTGLQDVLSLRVEPRGQAEAGEQPGVEEVVDVRHLPG